MTSDMGHRNRLLLRCELRSCAEIIISFGYDLFGDCSHVGRPKADTQGYKDLS